MQEYTHVCCAWCGSEYVHHGHITAHVGLSEDNDGSAITIFGLGTQSKPAKRSEFLGRRDDIVIALRCEECQQESRIEIMQHKGQTLLRTVRVQ